MFIYLQIYFVILNAKNELQIKITINPWKQNDAYMPKYQAIICSDNDLAYSSSHPCEEIWNETGW